MKRISVIVAAVVILASALAFSAEGAVNADRVIDMAKAKVSYDIKTEAPGDIVITADYDSKRPTPEIENMDILPMNPIEDGAMDFKIRSKEGVPILIRYAYSRGALADVSISSEPSNPSSDAEYSRILSVESRGGHIINFTFVWQGKELKEVRIDPLVNPFDSN